MPRPTTPDDSASLHRIRGRIGARKGWGGWQPTLFLGIVTLAAAFVSLALQQGGFAPLGAAAAGLFIASIWTRCTALRRDLRKAEARQSQTQQIIATTPDGVVTFDGQGSILSLNPAAEKMFQQSEIAVVGQNVGVLIPQRLFLHDTAARSRGMLTVMGQRQGYYPFPIEISLNEMEVGGRKQYVAIIRDVSGRERSEETLKHIGFGVSSETGEEFLRSLVNQLSRTLPNDFAFLLEVSGSGEDEVKTLTVSRAGAIQSSAASDLAHTAFGEALAKGFRVYPSAVRTRFPEDMILQHHAAESFVGMPLVDHRGRPVGLIGVLDGKPLGDTQIIESTLQIFASRAAAEIERKRFEEELAAEKERLAITLRAIGEGFITIDNEGRVLILNPVAEQLTGWLQTEAHGRVLGDVFQLKSDRTHRRFTREISEIVEVGATEAFTAPVLLVSRENAERLVECSTSPIRDKSNRKVGTVIIFRDVTERQRASEEHQKAERLESLGVVAGGIAHDFNNLLTAILGNISLALLAPEIATKTGERLSAAKTATNRAQELARQLLTFARGGAPIKQTASVAQLLRDTVSCTLHDSKAVCEYALADDLWAADIDPGQISQVIHSLTLNADQAMPAGGTVRVTGENVELYTDSLSLGLRAGRWVKLSIRDEGTGIAEQYLKKIFDPYFTTKPKGSGLGLATAYSIVKNHSGVIGVDSQPGAGSTFTLCLPASQNPLPSVSALPSHASAGSARVLVLDDEEAICMIVNCALTDLGYAVTETSDGEAALAAYRTAMEAGEKFDLVISDLTIPGGMGGQETIRRLLELDPEVRAIVSSGYANDPVMSRYEDFGFSGMIAKPYELDALGRKVAEVLAAPKRPKVVYHDFASRMTA